MISVKLASKRIMEVAIAAWVLGKPVSMKIRGTGEQIHALNEAMLATRAFNVELENKNATIDSVMEKLDIKRRACESFCNKCNMSWPL